MNLKVSPHVLRKAGQLPVLPQVGALCYRICRGKPQILLITTRETGRWIIPKGWPIDGMTSHQTAAQEAWEEAGAVGSCLKHSVGQFTYIKERRDKQNVICVVEVFPLHVQKMLDEFPERAERSQRWLSPKKAAARVIEPDLAELLQGFSPNSH